jgi:hypothetical protein
LYVPGGVTPEEPDAPVLVPAQPIISPRKRNVATIAPLDKTRRRPPTTNTLKNDNGVANRDARRAFLLSHPPASPEAVPDVVTVTVTGELLPGVIELGLKVQVENAGAPVHFKLMEFGKLPPTELKFKT